MQTITDQVSAVVDDRIAAFNQTLDTKSREMDKRKDKKLKSQKQVFQDKHNKVQYEHNCDMLDKLVFPCISTFGVCLEHHPA